jgi:hypothetical protein
VIVLEFRGGDYRIELNALPADHLMEILPWFDGNQGRRFGERIEAEFAAYSEGDIKGGGRKKRGREHETNIWIVSMQRGAN